MKRKLFASVCLGLILIASVFSPITATFVSAAPVLPVLATNQEDVDKTGCRWYEFGCQFIMGWATIWTFTPFLLATVSGLILDYSLYTSISSGTYTFYDGTTGDEGFVITGWKLVRDFSNLIFIFALFVVAFVLILGLDRGESGPINLDPKKTVARVIIMALLVNFSFFLGRSLIDVTNLIAMQFYNRITTAPTMQDASLYGIEASDIQSFYQDVGGIKSVAIGILSLTNPQEFVLKNKGDGFFGTLSNYPTIWFYTIMSAAFSLFLVYLFLSIALLFIARTIGLFFGIILSPIAFVSYTVPFLKKQSYLGFDDWMSQFIGLAFMAPIFMFFLYISLQFFMIPFKQNAGLISGAASIAFRFAMVTFLLILAKRITKDLSGKMGAMVSGAVTSVITTGAMIAGAVATGGTSAGLMVARQAGTRALTSAGRAIGSKGVAAVQQRLAGTNFRSIGNVFRDRGATPSLAGSGFKAPGLGIGKELKNYGKGLMGTTMDLAKLSGSKVPDKLTSAFKQGQQKGKVKDPKYAEQQRVKNGSVDVEDKKTTPSVNTPTPLSPAAGKAQDMLTNMLSLIRNYYSK